VPLAPKTTVLQLFSC